MSYDSSKLKAIAGLGIGSGSMFLYSSTQKSSDVTVTGFFASAGAASRNPAGGMKPGDIVLVQESTNSPGTPGRVTLHSVVSCTANQASTSSSTGWGAGYNCSLTST